MPNVLMERDWYFILESIYRINSQTDMWEMEQETLRCLAQFIPQTQGTFFIYDGANSEPPTLVDSTAVIGDEARYLDLFVNGDYDKDQYFAGLLLFRNESVFRDSDLMTDEFRMESKLYQDIYEPQGIHWGLRAYLTYEDKLIGNISLFNAKERGDFTNRDVRVLQLLEPHISLKLWELQTSAASEDAQALSKQALYDLAAKYSLTARETEVLELALSGKDDRTIAQMLFISFSTFKKHMGNIYKKMDVNNRIQLFNTAKIERP